MDELVRFFNDVELRWSETVDQALLGYQGSWELGMTNLQGQIRQFERFDPLDGASFDTPNALVVRMEALAGRSASPAVRTRLDFMLKGWRLFAYFARISRELRYARRYITKTEDPMRRVDRMPGLVFDDTWSSSTIPAPTDALLTQALTRLNGWLADPLVFRAQVREALNVRLSEIGVLRIVGTSLEAASSGDDTLADGQFVLDYRSVNGYLNAWNARTATSFNLANKDGIDAKSGLFGALVADLKRNTASIADAVRNFVSGGSPTVLVAPMDVFRVRPEFSGPSVDRWLNEA